MTRAIPEMMCACILQLYLRTALRNPQCVGAHYFQYIDEPTAGRGDGENYQIGWVDATDTPYAELVEAGREIGAALYPIASGVKSSGSRERQS